MSGPSGWPGLLCAATEGCSTAFGQSPTSSLVGGAVQSAAGAAGSAVLHLLAGSIWHAAEEVCGKIQALLVPEPGPILQGGTYLSKIELMAEVAAYVAGPMLFATTIGAVLRRDTARLARAWLVAAPLAGVATVLLLPLVSVALQFSDAMTSIVTASAGSTAMKSVLSLLPVTVATEGALGAVVGVVVLVAGVVLWLELQLRAAAILIAVLFLPLVLAAQLWPPTAHALRRSLEVLAALILSKFVVAAVLVLGAGVLGQNQLTGTAVLILAAFAPMAVLRLVPVVDAAAIGHLEGRARQPLRAPMDVAMRADAAIPMVKTLMEAGALAGGWRSGDTGAGGGAEATARDVPPIRTAISGGAEDALDLGDPPDPGSDGGGGGDPGTSGPAAPPAGPRPPGGGQGGGGGAASGDRPGRAGGGSGVGDPWPSADGTATRPGLPAPAAADAGQPLGTDVEEGAWSSVLPAYDWPEEPTTGTRPAGTGAPVQGDRDEPS